MIEYLIMFAVGMVAGGLIAWWFTHRNIQMYKELWENEKVGNFSMMRRITALEKERGNPMKGAS